MKKISMLILAAALMFSMASCGNKDKDENGAGSAANTETAAESTAAPDASAAAEAAPSVSPLALENASDDVDMGKVEGDKLDDIDPENSTLDDSGEIGGFEVSIDDAKVIDYDGKKVIVISYEFENNTSSPMSFASIMEEEVTQNGIELPAEFVIGVEGVNTNSAMEQVESGRSIELQGTYLLRDETTDVNVVVHKFGEANGASVSKAFKLQ